MFSPRRGRTRGDCTLAARAARGSSSRYWLIAKNDNGWTKALIINLEGQVTIPIFSFREEAEMFAQFEAGGSWWVRETSAEELASLLFGPYSCVKMVALDPLPEICHEGTTLLVSVRRNDFALKLLGDRGMRVTPAPGSATQRALRAQRRRQPSQHAW